MKWAEPVEKDAKQRLRKFYESNSLPQEWATDLSAVLLEEFSHKQICRRYNEVFDGLI